MKLTPEQIQAARAIVNAGAYKPWEIKGQRQSRNAKHNLNFDFGYPETEELGFHDFYDMWRRNGIAHALTTKTGLKTWQENPQLLEREEDHDETPLEREIRQHFARIRFWQALHEADVRSMVGKYAGVIFQLGDGKRYDEPVDRVPGGIDGLISVLPAWEGQLEPSSWDGRPDSPTYGQPMQFRFNESAVDPETGKVRSFTVHPDRVYIWSKDRTTWGESKFEACYNALLDMEKIRGAGAEGFWKNAKAQPILEAGADVDFNQLATMLGTDLDGIPDALDEVVGKWTKGFDQSLILQSMQAKTLPVSLPQPREFADVATQEIAAAWPIPQKVLIGMQTGERASTEDQREWAQTNMGWRETKCKPNIMDMVGRFVKWGMLPERDWFIHWADLMSASLPEKLDMADKMATINQKMALTGGPVFTDEEMRAVADYKTADDDGFSEVD